VTRETVEKWKSENRISDVAVQGYYAYQEPQPLGTKELIEFHVDDYEFLHSVADI
jgi:hypothetical protein